MAIEVDVDRLDVLETKEKDGHLERLVLVAQVRNIEDTDYTALMTALNAGSVPQYGDHLNDVWSDIDYDMVVKERNVKMIDSTTARVEIIYLNEIINPPQDLDDPRSGVVEGEVRCSVQQKTSNLDRDGNQITVTHTYPSDDPNHPDETITQGGEIQYFEAQRSVFIQGKKATSAPWLIANIIVGSVNESAWSGEAARTWLCTSCNWKLLNIPASGTEEYLMSFEFQFDADTWDPTVVFIDDVTGKPPADLIEGTGYKTIEKLYSSDFDDLIGAPILGG